MNIYIPKNKKKLKKSNFDIKKISNFEKKIFDIYNLGKIKYPIHLTKGNEVQLNEIFKYIHKNDWVFCSWRNHAHALLHGFPEKKLFNINIDAKTIFLERPNQINHFRVSNI